MRLSQSALYPFIAVALFSTALIGCGGGGDNNESGGTTVTPPTRYTVSTTKTGSGTISPTSASVAAGQTTQFTVSPLTGYELDSVTGCNGALQGNVYTTGAINANCTVSAVFSQSQVTVTTKLIGDPYFVTINPAQITMAYGASTTINVELFDDYLNLEDVTGCVVQSIDPLGGVKPVYAIEVGPVYNDCELEITVPEPPTTQGFRINLDLLNATSNFNGRLIGIGQPVEIVFSGYGDRNLSLFDIFRTGSDGQPIAGDGCSEATWDENSTTLSIASMNSNCTIKLEYRSANEFYFASNALQRAVRSALQLSPEEFLTVEQVGTIETITELGSPNNSYVIESLAGIEYATSLKNLLLRSNASDLSPLSGLPITNLSLTMSSRYSENNEVISLQPLTTLPLNYLQLREFSSKANDYDELGKLTQLRHLDLSLNLQLEDIGFVSNLPNLSSLILEYSRVMDLRPVLDTAIANPNGFLVVSGCASLQQRVTSEVRQQLQASGGQMVVQEMPNYSGTNPCPTGDGNYSGTVTASLSANEALVGWNYTSTSESSYPVQCMIYTNLTNEQPRQPQAVVENCANQGQLSMARFFDRYNFTVQIDDGVFPPITMGSATVVDDSLPPTAQRLVDIEWGMVTFNSNPLLIPGRPTMVRAHVVGNSTVTPDEVVLRLNLNGESQNITMDRPTALPSEPKYQSLNDSYRGVIGSDWMQAGLQIQLIRNDQVIYQQSPNFGDAHTLYMTIVPFTVNGIATELPSNAALKEAILRHWPLQDMVIEVAEPMIYDDSKPIGLSDLLYALSARHNADGAQHFYHGFFPREAMDPKNTFAGLAFVDGKVGVSNDESYFDDTFSHELGHNFGLSHVSCGTTGEPQYPYPTDTTGSVGISTNLSKIYPSTEYVDVMSYCWPKHVSDWSFNRVQDYFVRKPPLSFTESLSMSTDSDGQPQQSTFIAGLIEPLAQHSKVLRHDIINHPAGAEEPGVFTLIATDHQGRIYERSFAIKRLPDAMSTRHGYFEVRIPAISIKRITVYEFGKEVFSAEL